LIDVEGMRDARRLRVKMISGGEMNYVLLLYILMQMNRSFVIFNINVLITFDLMYWIEFPTVPYTRQELDNHLICQVKVQINDGI
jgi:hypothetical protein